MNLLNSIFLTRIETKLAFSFLRLLVFELSLLNFSSEFLLILFIFKWHLFVKTVVDWVDKSFVLVKVFYHEAWNWFLVLRVEFQKILLFIHHRFCILLGIVFRSCWWIVILIWYFFLDVLRKHPCWTIKFFIFSFLIWDDFSIFPVAINDF